MLCPSCSLVIYPRSLGSLLPIRTVWIFHRRIDLSSDPDARVLESGLHAIVEMPARCPSSV